MTDSNMICPKCKTFQPAAENCRECGAIVAKLWARHSAKDTPGTQEATPGASRKGMVRATACLAVIAALALGTWMLAGDEEGSADTVGRAGSIDPLVEAARRAQREAEQLEARWRGANGAVEMDGSAYVTARPTEPGDLDLDLDRFAAELNAVATITTVALAGTDLQRVFRSCARLTDRYFGPLRYRDRAHYPLPTPQTRPWRKGAFDGRVRCEGDAGTVYSPSGPRTREGISACWSKERDSGTHVWVRMQWDAEDERWALYSRADRRAVDRQRLEQARLTLAEDIAHQQRQRENRARTSIPRLVAAIEGLREERTAASDERQRTIDRLLGTHEAELRHALVDERYGEICEAAASAALDARERRL